MFVMGKTGIPAALSAFTERVKMTKTIESGQEHYFRPYRWVMLILIALIQISTNFCNIQISALAGNVMEALNLTTAQFGAVSSCSFLGGAICGFICGTLGDRYGIKKVIAITGIISVIGAILRLYSGSFITLFASMFIIGIVMAALNANSAKIIAMWFHPTHMSVAMSIYIACSTVGAVLALSTTPVFLVRGMSIRQVYMVGLITVVIAVVLWILLAKVKPEGAPDVKSEPVMKYIKNVIGNRHLWINSVAMFCMMGAFISCSTYMVVGATTVKGMSAIEAGVLSSVSSIVAVPLMLVIPALITKTGYMKAGTILICILGAALLCISWSIPGFGIGAMVLFVLGISLIGNGIPLMKQWPALLPGIHQDSVGTAGGVQSTMQNLGAFLVPSYILGTIVGSQINLIFYGIAVVIVISAVLMLFVPDIGTKARQKAGVSDEALEEEFFRSTDEA